MNAVGGSEIAVPHQINSKERQGDAIQDIHSDNDHRVKRYMAARIRCSLTDRSKMASQVLIRNARFA